MGQKKKVFLMISLILILQIVFPVLNVIVENNFSAKAFADEIEIQGIEWKYVINNGKAIIEPKNKESLPANVVIPSTIGEYEVKSINENAFRGCSTIESIEIPSTITKVSNSSFQDCINLKTVILHQGLKEIGDYAFWRTKITSINIPSSVEIIGSLAFFCCKDLKTIVFNEGLKEIGAAAFSNAAIESVDIPSTVENIKGSAFEECKNLKTVRLHEGLKKVGNFAFEGSTSITNIEIPSTVEEIGECSFSTPHEMNGAKPTALKNVILHEGLKKIGKGAFENSIIENISIPSTVEEIGNYAFNDCEQLTNITLNEGLKTIGQRAFQWTNIKKISIPRSVESIGEYFITNPSVNYPKTGITVYCYKDSYAQQYCIENDYNYVIKQISKIEIIHAPNKTSYIEGENFDKTGMVVKSTYNDGDKKIITNYSIENGENLQLEQTSVTIRYTEDEITKEVIQSIIVTQKEEESLYININNYKESEDQQYITDIKINTNLKELTDNITTNGIIEVYDGQTKITNSNTKLKTGMKLKISLEDKVLENKIVINGDTNGDGMADIKDILSINKHRLNKQRLTNEYLLAGDVNKDNNVDIKDLLQVNKYRLGKINNL